MILRAPAGEPIPLYGDGLNARLVVCGRSRGGAAAGGDAAARRKHCVGGSGERNNHQVVEAICALMDQLRPQGAPHGRLITYVDDRPGHDRRHAIDPTLIRGELGWQPHYSFAQLETTVRWFLDHPDWCELLNRRSSQTRS